MKEQVFPIDTKIIASAIKDGIMLKLDSGFWHSFVGIVTLTYVQQFEKFVLVFTGQNPQDAKFVYLEDFGKTWDLKKK